VYLAHPKRTLCYETSELVEFELARPRLTNHLEHF